MENNFDEENYVEEKVTINIIWANIFGFIVLAVAIVLYGIPFFLVWLGNPPASGLVNTSMDLQIRLLNIVIVLIITILGTVAHELIHGIFFTLFAENKFKSVKFGILPASKLFSPYCHCKDKLRRNHYMICSIMPLIIVGIIPAIISIIIGNLILFILGILFTVGAAGDILVFVKLMKEEKDTWVFDSPTDVGYLVYRKRPGA